MSTTYTVGYGSQVAVAPITSGTVGSYVVIGQSRDIKGPDSDVGDIKLTNNDSPANTKEYAPGMIEPGSISFDLVYDPTTYNTIYTMFGDGLIYSWKETYVDGSTMVAPGFLKKAPITTKTEDEADSVSVEVRLTGRPTFSATGS